MRAARCMAAQYRPALVAAEADLQAARATVAEWLISQQAAINDVALYARNVTPTLAECHTLAEQLQTLLNDPRVRQEFAQSLRTRLTTSGWPRGAVTRKGGERAPACRGCAT